MAYSDNSEKMYNAMHKYIRAMLVIFLPTLILTNGQYVQWPEYDCDIEIHSVEGGKKTGTFKSPNWPDKYTDNMHCFFKFIGLPNERVHVNFTYFKVKGISPRCERDYVDIYTQGEYPEQDLLDIPLQGRYCGDQDGDEPPAMVSSGQTFIVGFFTDGDGKTAQGFFGNYAFIDDEQYNMGTPAPNKCGYTIHSRNKPTGMIMSPTFPGIYPDNAYCFYNLQGRQGERIKLDFEVFDLFSGGDHCPFDFVRIYDGYTSQTPIIGTYCGKHKKLTIFSTSEALHIEFVTKSGRVQPTAKPYKPYWELQKDYEIERTGFKAQYTFSDKFVKLNFIQGSNAHHIRGTECDMRVLSAGESNGTITSPNYPHAYPLNVTCRYYIDGFMDKQNLEKVRLNFEKFQLPVNGGRGHHHHHRHHQSSAMSLKMDDESRCPNGYVKAYGKGQTESDKPDGEFCGSEVESNFISSNPRLLLVFDSHGKKAGQGFKANYKFEVDYGIPSGTMATPRKCHFIYKSDGTTESKQGSTNSPRYPGSYPKDLNCVYEFHGLPNEQVRVSFDNFFLAGDKALCNEDYIVAYSIFPDGQKLIGKYCGSDFPGPIITEPGANRLKLIFHSNEKDVSVGFKANYDFIPKQHIFKECGANITRSHGGVITSPNYPQKYQINFSCEWWIYPTSPMNKILLQFEDFDMEGTPRSCQNAEVQIFTDNRGVPQESLCGTQNRDKQLISNGPMRIRFVVGQHSVGGGKGFKLSYTELLYDRGDDCSGVFKCQRSGYCIAKHLECNKVRNCGAEDESDETIACPKPPAYNVLHIALGVAITLFLLIIILVCMFHRRRRSMSQKVKHPHHNIKSDESDIRFMIDQAHCSKSSDRMINRETMQKISIV
ncbi:cubilin-like isoform X3 [Lineus longissimus]|uniref:cubilin-like isoform X3 n=1 Tax=Lineus longissimus TaxID=88925 RepID=UPI00315C8751